MRFGSLKLAEAEGAVVAHSLRLAGGALKKGHRLTDADLAMLAGEGVETVVAAKLDADDVGEDQAAAEVARAIMGSGLEAGRAFTGRVNLHATADGVCTVAVDRLDALNLVDEAVTCATLSPYEAVTAGQMVATIKIIPFAVPRPLLESCIKAAAGSLVSVAPYSTRRVRLIQTTLPGTKHSVLDKTVGITATRIKAVSGEFAGESRCPHKVAPLAAQIETALAAGCDLLLIAGASAITDRQDVLPAAIVAAGGKVEHFGMPVDPGNLILLARIGDVPVLGLPGCARSPKLNGFDWVLQRLAAGVAVGPRDIMRMGAGGLLTEIPTRPQPREGRKAGAAKVAAVVLAAGQSRRMGEVNKLLAEINGKPLVAHAVDAALASRAAPVVVVTGHEAERVKAALKGREVSFVHNPDYGDGLSASLRAGLDALPADADGALICLGDMPRVGAGEFDRLIAAFNPTEGRGIVLSTVRGKRGNPVLWSSAFFDDMRALHGDTGARHLIGEHADEVFEVELGDAAQLDVDTPAALAALREGAR